MHIIPILLATAINTVIADDEICGFSYTRSLNSRACRKIPTLSSLHDIDYKNCTASCARTMRCHSVNFYTNEKGGKTCEMLRQSASAHDGKCVIRPLENSEYDELVEVDYCLGPNRSGNKKRRKALPNDEYQFGDVTFKLVDDRKNWSDAQSACVTQDALLSPIVDALESKFVSEVVVEKVMITDNLPGELAHYRLDGTDLDVKLHGTAAYTDDPTKGAVLTQPGIAGSYADTPPIRDIARSPGITIALWIKIFSGGSQVFYADAEINKFFELGVNFRGKLRFKVSSTTLFHDLPFPINIWTHVAVTRNKANNDVKLYVNGIRQRNVMKAEMSDSYEPILGGRFILGRQSSGFLSGSLSQLFIYGRELSEDEVIRVKDVQTRGANKAWISINDVATEGRYQLSYLGAEDAAYLNCAPGFSSKAAEDCVAITSKARGGHMEENDCNGKKLAFVCQKKV